MRAHFFGGILARWAFIVSSLYKYAGRSGNVPLVCSMAGFPAFPMNWTFEYPKGLSRIADFLDQEVGRRAPLMVFWAVMGMPSLLRKIFLVDLLQGLKVTFRYQDPKEIYTEQYPLERPQVAERYRGAPRLNVNPDTDETMCIACDLCALACPEHLIVVSSERNEKTRRKELTNFTYDLSRCMFCGLCEDACPTDALELTQDFELASYTRQGWIWDRETLEKGPQPTQYQR
jgi:NADH-quinone oxidoreductase subunit I